MAASDTPVSIRNKDLILREKLALERTKMANDRTLLSFIRTSLYFAVAGLTINQVVELEYGTIVENISWLLSVVIVVIGVVKYIHFSRLIRESRKHIGNYLLEEE